MNDLAIVVLLMALVCAVLAGVLLNRHLMYGHVDEKVRLPIIFICIAVGLNASIFTALLQSGSEQPLLQIAAIWGSVFLFFVATIFSVVIAWIYEREKRPELRESSGRTSGGGL